VLSGVPCTGFPSNTPINSFTSNSGHFHDLIDGNLLSDGWQVRSIVRVVQDPIALTGSSQVVTLHPDTVSGVGESAIVYELNHSILGMGDEFWEYEYSWASGTGIQAIDKCGHTVMGFSWSRTFCTGQGHLLDPQPLPTIIEGGIPVTVSPNIPYDVALPPPWLSEWDEIAAPESAPVAGLYGRSGCFDGSQPCWSLGYHPKLTPDNSDWRYWHPVGDISYSNTAYGSLVADPTLPCNTWEGCGALAYPLFTVCELTSEFTPAATYSSGYDTIEDRFFPPLVGNCFQPTPTPPD
jgi:hypothetical protein